MSYIPPEVVEKAREMDLLTYLKNYEPQELVHVVTPKEMLDILNKEEA